MWNVPGLYVVLGGVNRRLFGEGLPGVELFLICQ